MRLLYLLTILFCCNLPFINAQKGPVDLFSEISLDSITEAKTTHALKLASPSEFEDYNYFVGLKVESFKNYLETIGDSRRLYEDKLQAIIHIQDLFLNGECKIFWNNSQQCKIQDCFGVYLRSSDRELRIKCYNFKQVDSFGSDSMTQRFDFALSIQILNKDNTLEEEVIFVGTLLSLLVWQMEIFPDQIIEELRVKLNHVYLELKK